MLRKYEKEETVEGHPLTLTCSVKGSSMVTFSWYKDQAPVHDHHFMRNMLISRDRQSDDGTHMSVLYIEKADQWDEGRAPRSNFGSILGLCLRRLHGIWLDGETSIIMWNNVVTPTRYFMWKHYAC